MKHDSQSNTGIIPPNNFRQMITRVNRIRTRSKISSSTHHNQQESQKQKYKYKDHRDEYSTMNVTATEFQKGREIIHVNVRDQLGNHRNQYCLDERETDQMSTNFNPHQPEINTLLPVTNTNKTTSTANNKIFIRNALQNNNKLFSRKSIQLSSTSTDKKRPLTSYKYSSNNKNIKPSQIMLEAEVINENRAIIFKEQMSQLQNVYQHLANILESIKQYDLEVVENAISNYIECIQSKKISFIDDFMEGREKKLQQVIRWGRLHESLSVAYLFLQMAQARISNHQSYLTNFIGYCLSNLLLTARIYILKESKQQFQESQFERIIKKVQVASFGQKLSQLQDVLLRIQHNNEIITMMHRKLGKFNPKFETCIQLFFKNAERKKTSCTQCTYYIFQYLALHIHESDLIGISKCLQIAPAPYCPPPQKNYTLIIEPLGILINEGRVRPYLFQFMQWAWKYFEIILWTWQMPYEPEIQKIYQKLDEYLTSKLYRYHCIEENDIYVKDLSRLGRSLDKMLILDYDKRIFQKQPTHGIQFRWRPAPSQQLKDKGLLFLSQILQEMVSSDSPVEDTLKIFAEEFYSIKGY